MCQQIWEPPQTSAVAAMGQGGNCGAGSKVKVFHHLHCGADVAYQWLVELGGCTYPSQFVVMHVSLNPPFKAFRQVAESCGKESHRPKEQHIFFCLF